jgi:putative spermidine/putrescine transport system permease protein
LVINLFIAGRRVSTLPRRIWTSIQDNIDPAVASVATLLMLVTLCGILAYLSLERPNDALGQKEGG